MNAVIEKQQIEDKKKISVIIHSYHHRSKSRINGIAKDFLAGTPLEGCFDMIATCIDELIKNAAKANYKYMVLMQENGKQSSFHENPGVMRKVRDILNEQARFNDIMDRVYSEGRPLTGEERASLFQFSGYNAVTAQMRRENVIITLKLFLDNTSMRITVANSAPILQGDMERIHDKLRCIRKLRAEGREHEFFTNNMDTSQGGFGFGYALIDSCCSMMGVDTEEALTLRNGKETSIEIAIPLKRQEEDLCEVEFIEVA